MSTSIPHSLLATSNRAVEEVVLACLMPGTIGSYGVVTRVESTQRVDYGNAAKTMVVRSNPGIYVIESAFYVSHSTETRQGVYFDIYTNGSSSSPIVVRCASLSASLASPESSEYEECLFAPIFSKNALTIKIRPFFYGAYGVIKWKRYAA